MGYSPHIQEVPVFSFRLAGTMAIVGTIAAGKVRPNEQGYSSKSFPLHTLLKTT